MNLILKWQKKIQLVVHALKSSHLYLPIPGLGCGVLGLALRRSSKSIGEYAETLLKALEYRGYDSTGAAFLDEGRQVTLLKDVGAPSLLSKTLGINKQKGKIFCGQVRWATFGRVDQLNAQPHIVQCKRHLVGAHNGNITNSSEMKAFFNQHGHRVVSDNDGEIVVHAIEDAFDAKLKNYPENLHLEIEIRMRCMREAITMATQQLVGSFAAVIVDPVTEVSYAIKAGSSLYFGVGTLEQDGPFALASSDLTAVLRFTKNLVELKEGQFVEYTSEKYQVYAFTDLKIKRAGETELLIKSGQPLFSPPKKSKLRAEDTGLSSQFSYFMEQEIFAEVESTRSLAKLFDGGDEKSKEIATLLKKNGLFDFFNQNVAEEVVINEELIQKLEKSDQWAQIGPEIKKIVEPLLIDSSKNDFLQKYFFSSEKNTLLDFIGMNQTEERILLVKTIDAIFELRDAAVFSKLIESYGEKIKKSVSLNRNIYLLACGSSFHAAKTAALYFNEIAGIATIPLLPGEFRGQYQNCLRDHDLIIGISQSGETKDLVDVINYVESKNLAINKIMVVNNLNSTLGQEKCDVAIPINCGPEIAVPATKSFINQMMIFYYLAIKAFEKVATEEEVKLKRDFWNNSYREISLRISQTLKMRETIQSIDDAAEALYLAPSLQILATKISGIAKEGALKIRETVLNHAEGSEASEFKHGPNTILGRNTIWGISHLLLVDSFLKKGKTMIEALDQEVHNYPLIYITGPDERDINLTISQINTHKIRGSDTFVIAEENEQISANMKHHDDQGIYKSGHIVLPKTGSTLMATFTATVVLQLLSLKMSIKKMNYLNQLSFHNHGVHPDVPKNVSKSITVD